MTKKTFKRDSTRTSKKEIPKTEMSKPTETFELEEQNISTNVGRPKKNKIYGTIRTQRINVHRINSLQNVLEFETQDDLIEYLLNKEVNTLDVEKQTEYNIYLKMYKKRDNKQ